jgi:6-pyruvoyltetrahydropterin/6-carboxytetrahydropterin synthase
MIELMVEQEFDAAHALRGYQGPCENLHGHTWKAQVVLEGEKLNEIGILCDFKEVKKILWTVLEKFDHHNLNDLPEFSKINPSSENLAKYMFETLQPKFGALTPAVVLKKVTVWESRETCASYMLK